MNSYTARYLNLPASRTERAIEEPLGADVASAAAEVVPYTLPFADRMRMAADKPLETIGLAKDGKLRMGRVAGLGSILTLLAAASELSDPTESAGRNLAQAGGSAAGGLGGGAGGALLGGLLTAGNPLGILVGSAIGSALGGEAGKGVMSFAADLAEGSPESRALRSMQDQARAATELEAARIARLMPLQDQATQIAIKNETARNRANAEIARQQLFNQTLAQGLLAQQQGGVAQQLALTNAILGA